MNTDKNESAGKRLAAGIGSIRGVWLDEAEQAYEAGAAEKPESPFKRFLHSGWAVAAACAVTALAVWAAVMASGLAGGSDPAIGPSHRGENHDGAEIASDGMIIVCTWSTNGEMPDGVPAMSVSESIADSRTSYKTDIAPNPDVPDTVELPSAGSETQGGMMHLPMPARGDSLTLFWNAHPARVTVTLYRMEGDTAVPVGNPFEAEPTEYGLTLTAASDLPAEHEILLSVTAEWETGMKLYYNAILRDWGSSVSTLPTDDGLTVYVSAFGKDSYRCMLVPGTDPRETAVPMTGSGYSTEEMKEILAAYNLPADRIRVELYQDMLSSYVWPFELIEDADLSAEAQAAYRQEQYDSLVTTLRSLLGIPLTEND